MHAMLYLGFAHLVHLFLIWQFSFILFLSLIIFFHFGCCITILVLILPKITIPPLCSPKVTIPSTSPPKWSCSSTCPPKVIIFLQPYPKSGHTSQPSSKSGQAYPWTFPKRLPYLFHFTPKLTLPPIISSKAIMPFKIHPKTNHAPEHSPQKWSYPSALTPKVTTPHQPSPKRDHAPSTNHGPSIYHCLWSITTLQVWECSFASIQKWKTNHVWFWLVLLCLKHVCNTYQAPLCPFQSAVGKTTTVLTHTSVSIELDLGRLGIPCDQNSFPNRSNPY